MAGNMKESSIGLPWLFRLIKAVIHCILRYTRFKTSIILCIGFSISACVPSSIVYKYDINKKGKLIDDGEIWGTDVYLLFEESPYIEVDTLRSLMLNKKLQVILEKLQTETLTIRFDGIYYEYAFITQNRDTLYTNGYFELWKVDDRIIEIGPELSQFFTKRFDNPYPPPK